MNLSTLLIAFPIFMVVYQAVGMALDAREAQRWGTGAAAKESGTQTAMKQYINFSGKLGFNNMLLRNKNFNERLELLLLRSGNPFGWKPKDLVFCKELIALLVVFWLWRVGTVSPAAYVLGLGLGFWLPDMYFQGKATARQLSIQRRLPGFVDLLALALESGLDLMAAIERIMEKMGPSPLREETSMLIQEIRLGTPRKEALEHLAFRINLPDVQALTSIIIQSEELGTSLATVLRSYTEDMRNRRILRAEEAAGKAPVKLLFPMMVFFFPIVFVLIFGPLALNFMASGGLH
jgi:tight adherence protein C